MRVYRQAMTKTSSHTGPDEPTGGALRERPEGQVAYRFQGPPFLALLSFLDRKIPERKENHNGQRLTAFIYCVHATRAGKMHNLTHSEKNGTPLSKKNAMSCLYKNSTEKKREIEQGQKVEKALFSFSFLHRGATM